MFDLPLSTTAAEVAGKIYLSVGFQVPGQFLSLFYTDRLGLYPRVDQAGERQLYGGIPQRGNLRASLAKARADIIYYIPSRYKLV